MKRRKEGRGNGQRKGQEVRGGEREKERRREGERERQRNLPIPSVAETVE